MRTAIARLHAIMFAVLVSGCSASPPSTLAGGAKEPPAQSPPTAKRSAKISPEMVGTVSPIPAMIASGEGWTFEMQGKQGMEHRAVLLFQKGTKRFEGTLTFRESNERAGVRWMHFDGDLSNEAGAVRTTLMVGNEPCTDREGRSTRYTLRLVLGREEYVGCADLAMY